MSNFVILLTLISTNLAPVPPAKKPLPPPTGAAPHFGYVTKVTETSVVAETKSAVAIEEVVTVTELKNGMEVLVKKSVLVYRTVGHATEYQLNQVRFDDIEGKQIPQEKALKGLKGKVILIAVGARKKGLDPTWASVLRKDAIVMVFLGR